MITMAPFKKKSKIKNFLKSSIKKQKHVGKNHKNKKDLYIKIIISIRVGKFTTVRKRKNYQKLSKNKLLSKNRSVNNQIIKTF